MCMKIERKDGKIYVQSEYNRDFIAGVKSIGGRWMSPAWAVPAENEEMLDALLVRVYGRGCKPTETVDLLVDLGVLGEERGEIRLAGKLLARRPGRDARVILGEDVTLVSGEFRASGGSVKNPCVSADEGVIVKCWRVPVALYERCKDQPGVSIAERSEKGKLAALKIEREQLLQRLAEIEAEIAAAGASEQ